MTPEAINELSGSIIGASIEVHKALGPGLLESAYETCLCRELELMGISFQRQVPLPVTYKGVDLNCGYIQDTVLENRVVIELKSIEQVSRLHKAQLLTYLRLSSAGWGC